MIESVFGCYKFKMPQNNLHMVTPEGLDTNYKTNPEHVCMRDLL